MLQIGRSLVRLQMVSLDFFIDIKSFRKHYGPGVDSASNRSEYFRREQFLGVYHLAQNLLSSRLLSKNLKIKIYKTIILPVVLYGCEILSLILREERKVRVFENMVLRRVFGPRRDEITGEWRRLHNGELIYLYSSPNIVRVTKSRRMRWAGHVARMGEERGVCRVLVGKPEGRRPLGRPRRRWVDNIRMDLQEVGIWIGLGWPRIGTGGGRL